MTKVTTEARAGIDSRHNAATQNQQNGDGTRGSGAPARARRVRRPGTEAARSPAGHGAVAESSRGPVLELCSDGFRPRWVLVVFAPARGATSSWSDAGGVLGPTAFLLVGETPRSGAASHRIYCGAVELAASRPD